MIIWAGRGWIVAVVGCGCLVAAEYATEAAFGDDSYYQEHGWPKLAACLLAAVILFGVTRLPRMNRVRHLIDAETGEHLVLKPDDSFFFIPLKYWPYAAAVLGVVLSLVDWAEK